MNQIWYARHRRHSPRRTRDCTEVLSEVWLFLDHECDEKRRLLLEQHLDECSPCLEQYGIEEHLKVLLARKCGGEHAPEEFKQRLRDQIRKTVAEQGGVPVHDRLD